MTTLSYINKQGGTRSDQMLQETSELLIWCHENNILLQASHIKGSLNVMADQLSRSHQVIEAEWSLHPIVANLIKEEFFIPLNFAMRLNNKLTRFMSPFPDTTAEAVDAMSLDLTDRICYAFPPTALLTKVLAKLQQSPCCHMILVAPWWPKRLWFLILLHYSRSNPLELLLQENLLKPPKSNVFHNNLQMLALHA
jgi:hypothetical protein